MRSSEQQTTETSMRHEDREPSLLDKLWLCLKHYWND
jgi:hypothetical protein